MTALLDVACHLPEHQVDVTDVCAAIGADPQVLWTFRRLYGLRSVRRAPGRDHRSLLTAAVQALTGLRGNESRVRYVVLARTLGPATPAGDYPVEDLCTELGLVNAVGFTLSQHACAAGLLAMDLAGRLLTADGDPQALALVLTGEKIVTGVSEIIPESTVMGEGTAACLVGPSGERDRLLGFATRTLGRYAEQVPPRALDPDFVKEHNELLAEVIRQACRRAGVAVDDVALILPHNVNRLSWMWAARQLRIPTERIYLDNIPVTGHCFGADPFINHVHARAAGRLRPGDLYLMTSVGLGATFSAAVLRH
ncbi:3-oxoacyl-[acyl-carrier-protein] synthase III C-terminal domain-containing protein [Actinoplanes oblitus]|uniref:3-oxoacyl-[acyl-carrier-protein] synthase III C-terminal domain-containing protein n=1 Tax=Actinoplanes oblitus TaxID=3040509 RepID=A0ABY8WQQ4_9ACTN|nr:3-oxoacyl-[acyl-carrier-protein] synthase III C-terminal domain-containing protein [Actinoplanes oblitus]WIN00195.1 3-oxoacyl-[acyl-carrier-protein] synthase III C-terminal domain-containing protein [Actinoplanes oblitus]